MDKHSDRPPTHKIAKLVARYIERDLLVSLFSRIKFKDLQNAALGFLNGDEK
jgi:hypothetical protein